VVALQQIIVRALESVIGKNLQDLRRARHALIEKRAAIGGEKPGLVFDQRAAERKVRLIEFLIERSASRNIIPVEASRLGKK